MGVFDGVKILELGSGAAGPVATRYFVEQGARVVRIESRRRPDFLRLLALTPDSAHGVDDAPMFVLLNPGKESVAVDMTRAEGQAIVRRLVAWADVVSENFSPGVMDKLGLGYDALRAIRPDLVVVRSSLFGQTGPQRAYPGFGGQSSALAGFNHLTGWPDREALGPFGTIVDSLAPRYVALLVTAALLERRRSGLGQLIDFSQIEAAVYTLSETIVRYSANGEIVTRHGNEDEHAAPHGVYRCRHDDEGEIARARNIAIAIWSEGSWRALVREMGAPAWSAETRFASAAGRRAHRAELDARVESWTSEHDAFELMHRLQRAGIEAGVVQHEDDLLRDPQLAHRGHFRALMHRHLGELPFEHSAVRLEDSPPVLARAAPDLGEHTASVLEQVLGMSAEDVARLVEQGVLV